MNFEVDFIIWLQSFSSPFLDLMGKYTSYLFNYPCLFLVTIILFCFYKKDFAIYFLGVLGFSAGIQYGFKCMIDRPRPYIVSPLIRNVFPALGSSFPSGHSVTAMGIALFIGYIIVNSKMKKSKKIIFILLLCIYLLCNLLNRSYLGQHYLSDIFAGYALMFVIAVISYFVYPFFQKSWQFLFRNKKFEVKSEK